MVAKMRKGERREQLLAVAGSIIDTGGVDALTLGRLAEQAGITKPVVYDHFASRSALLVALYRELDAQQTEKLKRYLGDAEASLHGQAAAIARAHVECVVEHGRDVAGILGALEGSPALEKLKHETEGSYLESCRNALSVFARGGKVSTATMTAILGAAEALSQAASRQSLLPEDAITELTRIIVLTTT
ncbi:transcriptional regulator (plasmid) [Arthrobacter sp. MN05-02]|nr:transcriptional regulator [Arthrobacter sp. MN05-02]